ncbi:RCC1 domain-containing protein [Acrocarpospora catenulata]|uniref:RCC1 domain-containing protein n=1 Tax=Acrocarpospora catenulata TaxID=2836182 RepID=UPI001BDAFF6F|nr:hypothetical protein [Acrocarpospora catenulata]
MRTLVVVLCLMFIPLVPLAAPAAADDNWTHAAAWGGNLFGQLGDGTKDRRYTAVPVGDAELRFVKASAGSNSSVALAADGTVWTWGDNREGQLGNGESGLFKGKLLPVRALGLTDVIDVAAGDQFALALRRDGTVWSWGVNIVGSLGRTLSDKDPVPGPIPGLTGVTAISAGWAHGLALRANGEIWAWGNNSHNQLGIPNSHAVWEAFPVKTWSYEPVVAIAAGGQFSAAVHADGSMEEWGRGLGAQHYPWNVNDVRAISAGWDHMLILRSGGRVFATGENDEGQLGLGDLLPDGVPGGGYVPWLENVVKVSAGTEVSAVVRADGTVWTWGRNDTGQLGDGSQVPRRLLPVRVSGLTGATDVSAGAPALSNTNIGGHMLRIRQVPKPDFSLSLSPGAGTVDPGNPFVFHAEVTATHGFGAEVALNVQLDPEKETAGTPRIALSIDRPVVRPDDPDAAITLVPAAEVPPGVYTLTVTATSLGVTRTAPFQLTVNIPSE